MTPQTTTVGRVEIIRAGGPYHGAGSKPEGDHFTEADLEQIAADTTAMLAARELDPPLKLGHNAAQRIARDSGLVDEDGLPALGWIARVYRDGQSLYADVRDVPTKLATLIPTAWRKRSVELRRLRSQTEDGRPRFVVAGLALLGERLPAMRTLADVAALYADAATSVVALDDADAPTVVYLADEPTATASSAAASSADTPQPHAPDATAAGDPPNPPEEAAAVTFTDEQIAAMRSGLGLADDATPESVVAAVVAAARPADPAPAPAEGTVAMSQSEIDELRAGADAGRAAAAELRTLRHSNAVDDAIRQGRIAPAQRAAFVALYAADETAAAAAIAALPERAFGDVAGSDANPNGGDDFAAALDKMYAEAASLLGVETEA